MSEFFRPKTIWIGKLCYARIKLDREAYGGRPDLMIPVKIVDIRDSSTGFRAEIVLPNNDAHWLSADHLFDEIIGPTDFFRLGPGEPHREASAAPSTEKPESKPDDPTLYDDLQSLCHNFLAETRRNPTLWRNPDAFLEPIRDTVNQMLEEEPPANAKLLDACRAAESLIDEKIRKTGFWQGTVPSSVLASLREAIRDAEQR